MTDAKFHVSIVTLRIEDNTKLSKLLNERFKRSIHWNKYKVIFKTTTMNIYEKELMLVSKESRNYLFFLMQVIIILLMKIHIEDIFFQELK